MTNQTNNDFDVDNPVKRLYRILESTLKISNETQMKHVWADVLGIHRENNIALHIGVAELIQLYVLARKTIEETEDVNKEDYLRIFEPIGAVLSNLNLDQKWDRWRNLLDDKTMLVLKMAANTVSTKGGNAKIDEAELKKIQDTISNLIETVLSTEFESSDLKNIILDNLEQIRRAIISYRINGSEGLKKAIDGIKGSILLNKEEIIYELEKNKPFFQVFKEVIEVIANISQIASFELQIALLTSNLPPLLGSGD